MVSFSPQKRVIPVFVLAMLNISIMASLRNLPLVSELGYTTLFFFALVAIFFLIPSALVSAELATGWPKSGGIYIWVREAFGDRWGFFAVWMQWIHNVTWYPAIISFIATTIAYVIDPELIKNKFFVFAIILVIFWGMTLVNYLGIKTSGLISTFGVILGTLVPGIFVILLGITWVSNGKPLQIHFSPSALLPDFSDLGSYVFLTGLFLAFAGLEVSAGYAGEVKDPRKNYPRAIILASVITFVLFLLGSLAVAYVIPAKEISLVSGLMEAFHILLNRFHLGILFPVVGILLVLGALAEVNAWIIGPIKAMYTTSHHGNLPPLFQKLNQNGVPTNLLLFQAIIVTFIAFLFLLMPTLSTSYWMLTAVSIQIYLIMYIFMFIASIRLRYSKPHVPRPYRIPHPHKGIWIIAIFGLLASIFAFCIGFVPPQQLKVGNLFVYEGILILILLINIALPLIIYHFRKPSWIKRK